MYIKNVANTDTPTSANEDERQKSSGYLRKSHSYLDHLETRDLVSD